MHLLVPNGAKKSKLIHELKENKNIEVHYVNYVVFRGFDSIAHYFFRRKRAMMQCQNILVASCFLAINMGYERIELFGADHDWHNSLQLNSENKLCIADGHFYDKTKEPKLVPFLKLHSSDTYTLAEIFQVYSRVFRGHEKIKKYADSRGSKIYNASEKSFIDSYERISIPNK